MVDELLSDLFSLLSFLRGKNFSFEAQSYFFLMLQYNIFGDAFRWACKHFLIITKLRWQIRCSNHTEVIGLTWFLFSVWMWTLLLVKDDEKSYRLVIEIQTRIRCYVVFFAVVWQKLFDELKLECIGCDFSEIVREVRLLFHVCSAPWMVGFCVMIGASI